MLEKKVEKDGGRGERKDWKSEGKGGLEREETDKQKERIRES